MTAVAWIGGAVAVLIIAAWIAITARARRARWRQFTDPNRCWDCGQPYHFPCPEITDWRRAC